MFWIILAALAALLALLLIRAALFRPKEQPTPEPDSVECDSERAVETLTELVRCKTVSYLDPSLEDEGEFERLRSYIVGRFPHIHERCERERIGRTGLLYRWPGLESKSPTVLMSHYDVVPVNEDGWSRPAFEGLIEDGCLWGRGTLDTKQTLCGILEAAEKLMAEGFCPQNDIYFAFSGDEETFGPSAPAIVAELERRRVKPALVVDEGGAVVEGVFPGVSGPCALVGVGEKGTMSLKLSCKSEGGHASAPPRHTPVGRLAAAVVKIENHPFKHRLTPPVASMFDLLGRRSSFAYRVVFANLPLFLPLLGRLTALKGGEFNGMLRTTCAFTEMSGSPANNVLPPEASVGANLRIIGGDTTESAIEYLKKIAADEGISFQKISGSEPSPFSPTDSEGWEKTKRAIEQTWPGAVVSPYLMIAASDSRHYCKICDNVMRFSAAAMSSQDRARIHANDERIALEKIGRVVEFYIRLIKQC